MNPTQFYAHLALCTAAADLSSSKHPSASTHIDTTNVGGVVNRTLP